MENPRVNHTQEDDFLSHKPSQSTRRPTNGDGRGWKIAYPVEYF